MEINIYSGYIRDLIYLLKEEIEKLKEENKDSFSDFSIGELTAYEHTVNLMKSQALLFKISLDNIGFYDYEKFKEKNDQSINKDN